MACVMRMSVFVKQKTAYELRISDWSSDVCSSDLRCRRRCACADLPGPGFAGRFCRVGAGIARIVVGRGRCRGLIAKDAQALEHDQRLVDREEIGRASGRERVRQYG